MKFFKFTDGAVELARDEIALYPLAKKILSRDRGGKYPHDKDGRLKLYAFKEFTYIYHRCDFAAYPSQHGLTPSEAHKYAVENSGLPSDYEPDEVVTAFMKQYEREHLSQAKHSIKTLNRIFSMGDRLVEKIEYNLNQTLTLPTLTREQISELLAYQKQLLEISTTVPQQVKKLREAMNALEEEEKIQQIIRGGEIMSDSMNPDNDIENDNR